ncbi:S100P-binding protein [Pyxicephalus adspersus]|uniref:S100P-binding protein n=1 Tax=Pyxicephalus adspersus TaxID=30357 RepID=A0AAV3B0W8_PYXAD|nr:TPA: hypothetical protein GDO54_001194 [Pyxicephalus adspersus]
MKVTGESSDLSTGTANPERQVMLYPAVSEDPIPRTMEDLKISIVNDRATGLKRKAEENEAETPCTKKICSVFTSSTPHSSSLPSWSSPSTSKSKGVKPSNVSTPSHTLEKNSEFSDEWEDSLLEPSDDEDNSPLYLTVDEIESLLEDDFSAESLELGECYSASSPESEDLKEKVCTSPYSQLDGSHNLTETTLCEEDLNNYAAMAPSPQQSATHSPCDEKSKQECSIVGNLKSNSAQETNRHSNSAVQVSDKMQALPHQPVSGCPTNLPVQSSDSLFTMDVVVEWADDPDLSFDGDINDILVISPGGGTSSDEETAAELFMQCTEKNRSAVSDSTSNLKHSVPVNQLDNFVGSDAADVAQQLSPATSNSSDALKVNCHPSTICEPPKDSESSSISIVVNSETQWNTDAAEDGNPSTSTKSHGQSTLGLSHRPIIPSATQTSSSQETPTDCGTDSSAAAKERSRVVVTPLPRRAPRFFPSSLELEAQKNIYCDQVIMHINSQESHESDDPFQDLSSFLYKINQKNPHWQHPSNLSRRNHPRRGRKPIKQYTLNKWVEQNGGVMKRFKDIPSSFQRSPIPDVLPF